MLRYRRSVETNFYQALHELARRQAIRNGQAGAASIPVAVDVTVTSDRDESDESVTGSA